MNDDLRLALALADDADAITMRYFQSVALAVRTKSDRTPVSEADEAVERMIRERLERERPEDGKTIKPPTWRDPAEALKAEIARQSDEGR